MGKLGKETKKLLLAITIICLVSFLLAVGISFLLTKNFQHELLLHDYGVSGYQLNHEDELQISAFASLPNENDIERGREALASIGYDETTSMRFLPAVQTYRNQTVLSIFALLVFLFGAIYLSLFLYLQRQHKAFSKAVRAAGKSAKKNLSNSFSRPCRKSSKTFRYSTAERKKSIRN